MTSRRVELAIATAAAITAYALAFLPASPAVRWTGGAAAAALSLGALAVPWGSVPPRVVRAARLALRLLLVAIGALVVFSRQFPLVRYAQARQTGALVGAALALLALAFLSGRRAWPIHSHLLPALLGVLVAAGMERGSAWFAPIAGVAGLAVWVDAFRSGGPRRLGAPLLAAGAAAAALAAGIAWSLPVAQPYVQAWLAHAYGAGQTGLSDRSELGEIESLARSRRVVARVWTDRPQLLRMQVFSQFDGRRWAAFPADGRRMERIVRPRLGSLLGPVPGLVYVGDSGPVDVAGLAETRVLPDLWMEDGWGVLSPSGPLLLIWPGEGLALDDRGLVTTGGASAHLYGIANRPPTGSPVAPVPVDLALPMRLDPRVRTLAASLQAGDAPGPAVVARTVDHLRTRYRYTLDVGRFATHDPLAEFLFDKRAGYCEYFATAAVVLLRLQGVPARYVKGVGVRPEGLVGSHYVVREADAHAWVDAWTEGAGWTEVDPTPADGWALTHPEQRPGAIAAWWEGVTARVAQAWARWTQGTWPRLTAAAGRAAGVAWGFAQANRWPVAAVLAAGLFVAIRRRPRPGTRDDPSARARVAPELAAVLDRVERCWARAGSARPPARGLLEHLEAMPDRALSPEARALSERVVRAVYESAFAARPPEPAEVQALEAAVRVLPR